MIVYVAHYSEVDQPIQVFAKLELAKKWVKHMVLKECKWKRFPPGWRWAISFENHGRLELRQPANFVPRGYLVEAWILKYDVIE